jgi:hypothetical protein
MRLICNRLILEILQWAPCTVRMREVLHALGPTNCRLGSESLTLWTLPCASVHTFDKGILPISRGYTPNWLRLSLTPIIVFTTLAKKGKKRKNIYRLAIVQTLLKTVSKRSDKRKKKATTKTKQQLGFIYLE